ncbi:MAG: DNA-processing protein DprA, partial [Limnobacter sp.]|nr:DNA-processing protein DprA [Limnobacter sp.]
AMNYPQPLEITLDQKVTLAYHPELKPMQRLDLANAASPLQLSRLQPTAEVLQWIEHTYQWLGEAPDNRQVIGLTDSSYPARLKELKHPPLILYLEGNQKALNYRSVAMVGSRNASRQGLRTAEDFASGLCEAGWAVVSGLAEGIDTAAHQGALASHGATLAVLGHGLATIYPKRNQGLAKQIIELGGLLISEYPPHTAPQPAFFPRRNRLIAAIGQGTLVVEAAIRSGSLITARFASELGRSVMAIPGSIHSAHSKGCHQMIKKGALLVETLDDIEEECKASLPEGLMPAIPAKSSPEEKAETTEALLNQEKSVCPNWLDAEPTHIDELGRRSGLCAEELLSQLTELELEGIAVCDHGNRWQKVAISGLTSQKNT